MKWTRQQYLDMMTYNSPSRPMFSELFGPIIGLDQEWRAQGASEEMINMTAFAFDYVPIMSVGNLTPIHRPKDIVLENDADHYLGIDYLGRRVRMDKRTATIPLPETFPVETMDDWLKLKPMFCDDASRITADAIARAKVQQEQGVLIRAAIPGGYDTLRELMGEVNCCIAFYDDPELVWDILNTMAEVNERVLKEIARNLNLDILSVHEDMAGKSGPLIGPNLVSEFIAPYYRRAWDIAQESGAKLFIQDSDGNMNPVIDAFIEGGVNVFYPCEPAAGMDIVELRKKYGHRISFHGGIDKHVLRRTKEEIKAEVDYKLQDCMMDGGIVFGLDHRITNGTPLENYIFYIDYVREKLGMEDFRSAQPGWGRMAF